MGMQKWYSKFGIQFGNFLQSSIYIYHAPKYLATGNENICLHKHFYMNINGDFIFLIHNHQNPEIIKSNTAPGEWIRHCGYA